MLMKRTLFNVTLLIHCKLKFGPHEESCSKRVKFLASCEVARITNLSFMIEESVVCQTNDVVYIVDFQS